MIVRTGTWDHIKSNFSQEEKIILASCVTGHVVCPASICIDADNLPDELEHKLVEEVQKCPPLETKFISKLD